MNNEASNTTEIAKRPALANRFYVIDKLGQGAGSNVYLVADSKRDGKHVALKVLQNYEAFDEHTFDRFIEEMKICQEFRHPNLIEAYDYIDLGDSVAFTMEYVPGIDLFKLFSQKEKLEPKELDRIFIDILKPLQPLHEKGIVHRDLKLENILIREDGAVKVSDLGLMKKFNSKGLTAPGILLGTVHYMPPEYITKGEFDPRSDIYCVTIMLFEMLIKKRRLEGFEGREVISELIRTKFALPEAALSTLPRKYQEIIKKGAARHREDRYQSVIEMIQDLEKDHSDFLAEDTAIVTSSIGINSAAIRAIIEKPKKRNILQKVWYALFPGR